MSLSLNKVKAIIKKEFLPRLDCHGFKSAKDGLGGYRVRPGFVDVISIQIGRGASSLYLHYFTNMLCNPFTDILNVNTVGERFGGMDFGDKPWHVSDESDVYEIIRLMLGVVEDVIIPKFDVLSDLNTYADKLAYMEECKPYPLALSVLYAYLGKTEESMGMLKKIRGDLLEDEFFDLKNNNKNIFLMRNLDECIKSLQDGSIEEYLASWERKRKAEL